MTGILRALGALIFDTESAEPEDAEQPRPRRPAGAGSTVLVIDDDPNFLDIVRHLLDDAGFNVLTSSAGPKGLDMLRYATRDIRAVLLDYNMPKFNGEQTLEYARKLSPEVKIIGITGMDLKNVAENYRDGVDMLVSKPFKSEDLISSINAMVAGETTATTARSA